MRTSQEIQRERRKLFDDARAAGRELTEAERLRSVDLALEAKTIEHEERSASRRPGPDPDLGDYEEGTPGNPRRAPAGITHRGLDRPYSLLALCRAMKRGNYDLARVETRASDVMAERLSREPEGFFIPHRALFTREERQKWSKLDVELREIVKGTAASGGNLVGVDLMPDEFIEILRADSVTGALGARILPNLDSDVDITRQTAATAGAWLATETSSLTADTNFATSKVSLTPKTVGIRQDVSRRMLKQSTPGIEDIVRTDIRAQIGLAVDLAAMAGTAASGQPRGITQTSGVGSVDATGGLTWSDLVEFESDIAGGSALRGKLGYAMRSSIAGGLKTTLKASGVSGYIMADDGTVNGYPVMRSENVPASTIIFGNWADLLIGIWGGLDLFSDNVTLGDRGGLVLRGFQDCDIAIRHAASFSVCTNVP